MGGSFMMKGKKSEGSYRCDLSVHPVSSFQSAMTSAVGAEFTSVISVNALRFTRKNGGAFALKKQAFGLF